jgi:uncharacterized membrane protein
MSGKSDVSPTQQQLETLIKEIDPKTFESIPQKVRPKVAQLVQAAVIQTSISFSSGPLPPPESLARYNEIVPGAAERILRMAETQSDHRKQLENRTVDSQIRQSDRGQWLAFAIAIAFLIGAVITALYGHDTVAGILGGATVVSLAGAFIAGKVQQQRNLAEKRPGVRPRKREK